MKYLIFVVVASLAASGVAAAKGLQEELKNCTKTGRFCESCTSLVYCLPNGDGTWNKTKIETCESPEICTRGKCTQDPDPECNNIDFPCTSVGSFPHPFSWNYYIMCYQDSYGDLKSFLASCPSCTTKENPYGYGYNALSGVCNKKLDENSTKTYPVQPCSESGDVVHSFQDNAMFYYICQSIGNTQDEALYPVMYRCDCSKTFNDGLQQCTASTPTTTSTTTSTTTTTHRTPTTKSTTTSTTTPPTTTIQESLL